LNLKKYTESGLVENENNIVGVASVDCKLASIIWFLELPKYILFETGEIYNEFPFILMYPELSKLPVPLLIINCELDNALSLEIAISAEFETSAFNNALADHVPALTFATPVNVDEF
jgi:hypothetical protein